MPSICWKEKWKCNALEQDGSLLHQASGTGLPGPCSPASLAQTNRALAERAHPSWLGSAEPFWESSCCWLQSRAGVHSKVSTGPSLTAVWQQPELKAYFPLMVGLQERHQTVGARAMKRQMQERLFCRQGSNTFCKIASRDGLGTCDVKGRRPHTGQGCLCIHRRGQCQGLAPTVPSPPRAHFHSVWDLSLSSSCSLEFFKSGALSLSTGRCLCFI